MILAKISSQQMAHETESSEDDTKTLGALFTDHSLPSQSSRNKRSLRGLTMSLPDVIFKQHRKATLGIQKKAFQQLPRKEDKCKLAE